MLRTNEQLSELEPLLAFFATFVLETRLVQQIMRWDMAVLQESPWYQEIVQQGIEQGLQQGMRQGLLIGIALGLELKFGAEGLELLPEIREIEDVELLAEISEAIKTVDTLNALQQIYRTS